MKTDEELAVDLDNLKKEGLNAIGDIASLIEEGALVDPRIEQIAVAIDEKVKLFIYAYNEKRTLH